MIERRHQHQRERGQHGAQPKHELPGRHVRKPALRRLPGRDARRPADDEDGIAEEQLLVGEPVGQHLRHQHDQDRAADAGEQVAEQDHRIRLCEARDAAAQDHQRQSGCHDGLVAEAPPEEPARQRDRDARQDKAADQKADLRVADAEIADQEGRNGTRRLELIPKREPGCEQHGQNEPAACKHAVPLSVRVGTRPVALSTQRQGEEFSTRIMVNASLTAGQADRCAFSFTA